MITVGGRSLDFRHKQHALGTTAILCKIDLRCEPRGQGMLEAGFPTGLAGFGLAGRSIHSPLLKAAGLNVTDVLSSRFEEVAEVWPGANVVLDFESLLDSDVKLVVIATPSRHHYEQAKAALNAGKSVVVDKPLALTASECRELRATAEAKNQLLTVFHNRRWDSDFLTVRETLEKGLVGRPVRLLSHWHRHRQTITDRWRERPEPGAGVLFDLGTHLIDQACQLMGRPLWLQADVWHSRSDADVAADDSFEICLGYSNARVLLTCSSLAAGPSREMRIDGTQGSVTLSGFDPQEAHLRNGCSPQAEDFGEARKYINACFLGPDSDATPLSPARGEWTSFYEELKAALKDEAPAPVSLEDAILTAEIMDAARDSSLRGERIYFTP